MTEEQMKELFIEFCLTKKDRIFLSEPMNTRHEEMYKSFKQGLTLNEM